MKYTIGTQYEPCTLCITISSLNGPCTIRIKIQDYQKNNTVLIDRIEHVNDGQTVTSYLDLPLAPKIALVSVYNELLGHRERESSFKVVAIKRAALSTLKKAFDRIGPGLLSFIDFAQRFSYNAGILPTNAPGEAYCSQDKYYKIRYLGIINDDNGKELMTPARINVDTKIIQASKRLMVPLTVPGRFCIFTHEYSHLFENWSPEDEEEADINGITMTLALGFPKYEVKETFRNIFYHVNTEENRKRLKYIEDYIDNFETIVNKIKL